MSIGECLYVYVSISTRKKSDIFTMATTGRSLEDSSVKSSFWKTNIRKWNNCFSGHQVQYFGLTYSKVFFKFSYLKMEKAPCWKTKNISRFTDNK